MNKQIGDEATHRWTGGAARVPPALLRPFIGAIRLEVYLQPSTLGYRVPSEAEADAVA